MDSKQTTGLLILLFVSFAFWLYNTGKLKPIVDMIDNKATPGTGALTTTGINGNYGISPVNYAQLDSSGLEYPTRLNSIVNSDMSQATMSINPLAYHNPNLDVFGGLSNTGYYHAN